MNDAVALFIFNKYPKYVVAWLTLIKHSVISSLGLSKLAEFLGFWDNKGRFIQYNGNKEAKKGQLLEVKSTSEKKLSYGRSTNVK